MPNKTIEDYGDKKRAGFILGLIFAFGFPAVAWSYFDWRAGLAVFILGQFIIGMAKLLPTNKQN